MPDPMNALAITCFILGMLFGGVLMKTSDFIYPTACIMVE